MGWATAHFQTCVATLQWCHDCKTRENFNFMKKGKMIISVKIQNFSRSRMTKRTSPLESSPEI